MATSSDLRATLSALRHVAELRARVEALESENQQLRAQIADALAIVTAVRDEARRRLVAEAQIAHGVTPAAATDEAERSS